MSGTTGYVLTIAGHDPSGGAGLIADVQAILLSGAMPLSVCTSITYQTHNACHGLRSLSLEDIQSQLMPLLSSYPIGAVKIGLFPRVYDLCELLATIREQLPHVPIVWDPVLKTSSGYVFHDIFSESELKSILSHCTIATPNREEVCVLAGTECPDKGAQKLSAITPILLKGGHDTGDFVMDKLFSGKLEEVFRAKRIEGLSLHGSGCAHSSALASYLAQGSTLVEASRRAFEYMQQLFQPGVEDRLQERKVLHQIYN